jgi:polyhydroxybutyrate depolymerase
MFCTFRRPTTAGLVALLLACAHGAASPPPEGTRADASAEAADAPFSGADLATRDVATPDVAAPAADGPSDAGQPGAACGTTTLAEGDGTLAVGGTMRSYRVRLPAGYTNQRAWPLVLALHPNGSNLEYWDGTDRPLRRVLSNAAILVHAAARTGDWRDDLPADLAYFDALIERLKSGLCVDTRRIFSVGFSGGGSFSGVLGCLRRDIRAIATGGAVTYFDGKACVGSPAAWVTIGMGELIPARESFRDFWRTRNACQPATAPTAPSPCVAYACPPATPVHFCPHPGGHEWPAFGTEAVWSFFARF